MLPKHPHSSQNTHILQNPHIHKPTHYKIHTYSHPHITKPTHTHTHILQNPHIHKPTHYKTHTYTHTHILQNKLNNHNTRDTPNEIVTIHQVPTVGHPNVRGTFVPKIFNSVHVTSLIYTQSPHEFPCLQLHS
jgi:hypothetical protein